MSGSFESVRWNARVHRLDLSLYCHPKECLGNESEPMLTPRERDLLYRGCKGRPNPRDAASRRTCEPPTELSRPGTIFLCLMLSGKSTYTEDKAYKNNYAVGSQGTDRLKSMTTY